MIKRQVHPLVLQALSPQAVVALLGPRQVGKTTLVLEISQKTPSIYLGLEPQLDRDKLFDPELYLSQLVYFLVCAACLKQFFGRKRQRARILFQGFPKCKHLI